MSFQRVIILDLVSLGIGESSDANHYDSVGADTLGHALTTEPMTDLFPTLTKLGLGNIRYQNPMAQIPEVAEPIGMYGKIQLAGKGNGIDSGIREMFDYQSQFRTTSMIDAVVEANPIDNQAVIISDYRSYFANQLRSVNIHVSDNGSVWWALHRQAIRHHPGLVYARLSDLSRLSMEKDKDTYMGALVDADKQLARLINELFSTDLLLITASFANDMDFEQTPTREYLPLIAYSSSIKKGKSIGIRRNLSDISATIGEMFGVEMTDDNFGHSFLRELEDSRAN
ncbi:phosphopentomutase [Lentilactobacillus sp. Marseille-Q4993]|uniref:phosphopentomutase n=1 Tax=Lentilactobacillus sp. Marseille-Q4993 TaxID=3039492 RepID=UPI0024BD4D78|nr:phosphopentomutase [Lentilactobacillus sp. Marseille-Q4993]